MTLKRLIMQIRFWMYMGNGYKRAKYAQKKKIFAEIGEGSKIPMLLPLYPQLVRIHDNVIMHRSVKMVTHDLSNSFLERVSDENHFRNREIYSPIEIFDNVYVGSDVTILGNVRIGPNAIINAGSIVTKDIPPNSIVEGVPAKVIGDFDKYVKLRVMMDRALPFELKRSGRESIDAETIRQVWARFDCKKNKKRV